MVTKYLRFLCITVIICAIYFPSRHARYYEFIPMTNVLEEMVFTYSSQNSNRCNYSEILLNNAEIPINYVTQQNSYIMPLKGGEFVPRHCKALIDMALIVPYRNRSAQLKIFLNYMHNFLQQQNLHYVIVVVEQNNTLEFNRAELLNYGAKYAIEKNYPCLILHDVDLFPLSTGNLYGCSQRPRHMSSSLDTFRFNLPYLTLFGGATAILTSQFQQVNGMSNLFYGWGGEDDDFYNRLAKHNIHPYRFDARISRYTMLVHKKEQKNAKRFTLLRTTFSSGLDSLNKKHTVVLENLFTRIVVT